MSKVLANQLLERDGADKSALNDGCRKIKDGNYRKIEDGDCREIEDGNCRDAEDRDYRDIEDGDCCGDEDGGYRDVDDDGCCDIDDGVCRSIWVGLMMAYFAIAEMANVMASMFILGLFTVYFTALK